MTLTKENVAVNMSLYRTKLHLVAILKTPSSGKSTVVAKVYPHFFMSDGLVHACEE